MRITISILAAALLFGGTILAQPPAPGEEPAPSAEPVGAPAAAEPAPVAAKANERRRDPFRPFTLDLRPERRAEPLTPLQRYDLPQLRLAGVLLEARPPRAMLEDNSGMGFIVIPGTPIGRNQGVVKAIEPGRVVVEEKILDFYGNEQVQRVVLELPNENEPQRDSQE